MEFYTFGLGENTTENSVNILGGKGAGLVWMDQLGVPVPPGFVIPTTLYTQYAKAPKGTMKEIGKLLPTYLMKLGKHFGYMPLLSVRSGARVSCPGLMDTILNVGLDPSNANFWVGKLEQNCWKDSLHRLITMYGSVVNGIKREELEEGSFKDAILVYEKHAKEAFPKAKDQLLGSIEAVFKSWNNQRNKIYRKLHNIPDEWGTAVTVQSMVFGNLNLNSGTGVLFTRNPDTGENKVTGEYLINAQGEDVVAGIRTPKPLTDLPTDLGNDIYIDLLETVKKLELTKKDMQDCEFTIQDGKLYLLQTRNGKRSAQAAIRIALEMAKEGLITEQEVIKRVSPKQLDLAQIPVIDPAFKTAPMFQGIGACSGVVMGKPVYTAADAINCKEPCILITKETTPDDIGGMLAARGVITMEGGLTSHAAVVARGENKPCITGVGEDVEIFKNHGGVVSMDGATGRIWLEKIPVIDGSSNPLIEEFKELVITTTGMVPVITEVPKKKMKQALLQMGVNMFHANKAAILICETSSMVEKLYVDLSCSLDAEADFFSICKTFSPSQKVIDELKSVNAEEPNVTFIGDVDQKGFKMIGSCQDLKSLILATEEVAVSANMGEGDAAMSWVLKHKKAEGLSMISLGKYMANTKSVVSLEQALVGVQTVC